MPRDDARDAALDAPLDPRTMTPVWYARETRLAHMLPYVSLVDDQTVRTGSTSSSAASGSRGSTATRRTMPISTR